MKLFVIRCDTIHCGNSAANVIAESIEDAIKLFRKNNAIVDKSYNILSIQDKGPIISEATTP